MQTFEQIDVLLIEDNQADAEIIDYLLSESISDYTFYHVKDLKSGLSLMSQASINIVLLDLGLPDSLGLEGVEQIAEQFADIAIIILSGNTDESQALESLSSGAQDYLVKGDFDARLLKRTIRYAQERKRAEVALRRSACIDVVTGLSNRTDFLSQLSSAIKRAQPRNQQLAVLFLDLDNFKNLNDSYGHAAGDDLLRAVGERLLASVRHSDVVARLGGDEFTILLDNVESVQAVQGVADKVLHIMRDKFDVIKGVNLVVTPSIGIAVFPEAGVDVDSLLKSADMAMYRAKDQGRNNAVFYDASMNEDVREAFEMECSLREVLARNELELYYQPIYDLRQEKVVAAEALLRWRRPGSSEVILPGKFIPILELSGMIGRIGVWILEKACHQCKEWQATLDESLRICVNISPSQLKDSGFPNKVRRALTMSHLSPASLEIEITEQVLIEDVENAYKILTELKEIGVGISFDDFGSGYSSLGYLSSLPFDTIKIDQGFIKKIPEEESSKLIACSIISIAHGLGRRVIAEGIETYAQLEFLAAVDCEEVQGQLLTEPLPADKFYRFYKSNQVHDLLTELVFVSE